MRKLQSPLRASLSASGHGRSGRPGRLVDGCCVHRRANTGHTVASSQQQAVPFSRDQSSFRTDMCRPAPVKAVAGSQYNTRNMPVDGEGGCPRLRGRGWLSPKSQDCAAAVFPPFLTVNMRPAVTQPGTASCQKVNPVSGGGVGYIVLSPALTATSVWFAGVLWLAGPLHLQSASIQSQGIRVPPATRMSRGLEPDIQHSNRPRAVPSSAEQTHIAGGRPWWALAGPRSS